MTKSSRYAKQIIITQAGTIKLGLSKASFRVNQGRVIWGRDNRVSLYDSGGYESKKSHLVSYSMHNSQVDT